MPNCQGFSVQWGNIISTVGDTISTLEVVQCHGGYHQDVLLLLQKLSSYMILIFIDQILTGTQLEINHLPFIF